MEQQKTRYSFVYENLKNRILSGQVLPGNHLPSSLRLCDEFNVGLPTVRNALNSLKDEGFIEIHPRCAPIVRRCNEADFFQGSELSVLQQRDHLLQIHQTFALILPPIMSFSSHGHNIEALPHYNDAAKIAVSEKKCGKWRIMSDLGHDVLKCSGNPLFNDLFTIYLQNGAFGYFTERCSFFRNRFLQDVPSVSSRLIEILKCEDPARKINQFTEVYEWLSNAVLATIKHLEAECSELPLQSVSDFTWDTIRGHNYCYSRIIRDIINKIGLNEYPVGTFLPPEAKLSKQYDVSISTVRRALSQLEELGYSRTLNGRGTIVLVPDHSNITAALQNQALRRQALHYLHAIQLMVLIIRPAALRAAQNLQSEDLKILAAHVQKPGTILISHIFDILLKRLDLVPLRTILAEVGRLTQWGYCLSLSPDKKYSLSLLNKKGMQAYHNLSNNNLKAFAMNLEDCYRQLLRFVRKFVVDQCHFNGALAVRIPDKRYVPAPARSIP